MPRFAMKAQTFAESGVVLNVMQNRRSAATYGHTHQRTRTVNLMFVCAMCQYPFARCVASPAVFVSWHGSHSSSLLLSSSEPPCHSGTL